MTEMSSRRSFVWALALALSLFLVMAANAATWYVDPINGNDSNVGTGGWGNAKASIQGVLDDIDLDSPNDEVWVRAGTYTPSVQVDLNNSGGSDARRKTFEIPPGLTLLGGFNGTETLASQANPASNVTILSGDLGKSGNAFHVLVIEHILPDNYVTTTVIDGFTITGGKANGVLENATGGGAWLQEINGTSGATGGGAVFRRCIFEDNFADAGGGAVVGYRIGTIFRDCTFRNNEVKSDEFGTNVFPGGGAVNIIGKIIAVNCRFESNVSAAGQAGALYHYSGQAQGSVLSNCDFRANTAATDGGAVVLLDDNSKLLAHVTNCLFAGNVATTSDGGAVDSVDCVHGCTFVRNHAGGS